MQILWDCIRILKLKKPVDLIVKTTKGRDCDAYYLPRYSDRTGKLNGHKVVIYAYGATRPFNVLLAHELIHAAQEEQNKQELHGEFFQAKAKQLQEQLNLSEIYLCDVDED